MTYVFSKSFGYCCLLILMTLGIGCEKTGIEKDLYIEAALVPYFERFEEEGQLRGLSIDLASKNIEGYLISISEENVVGQCTYGSSTVRRVNIDTEYWNQATELEKEFVVFHELGHCYLERPHSDNQENKICQSMMHSGTGDCRFRYSTTTRTTYLNELFEQ